MNKKAHNFRRNYSQSAGISNSFALCSYSVCVTRGLKCAKNEYAPNKANSANIYCTFAFSLPLAVINAPISFILSMTQANLHAPWPLKESHHKSIRKLFVMYAVSATVWFIRGSVDRSWNAPHVCDHYTHWTLDDLQLWVRSPPPEAWQEKVCTVFEMNAAFGPYPFHTIPGVHRDPVDPLSRFTHSQKVNQLDRVHRSNFI